MIAVITGDIINSREGTVKKWIQYLKETLDQYGKEPEDWELFRGDSFQLVLPPEDAILAAIHIKAAVKQSKAHDVRMAIGLGEETYKPSKVTESNGSAYVHSGDCFENLKKQTLAIKTEDEKFNQTFNVMLHLALLTADHWSSTVARVIKTAIENPDKNQMALAELLDKSQSTMSESLKRGGFEQIMNMNAFYKNEIARFK